MTEIRLQSVEEDLFSVHLGENVVICDLTKADAEALVATYRALERPV